MFSSKVNVCPIPIGGWTTMENDHNAVLPRINLRYEWLLDLHFIRNGFHKGSSTETQYITQP